jgi:hypothetical protein
VRCIQDDVKDLLTKESSHDDCIFHIVDKIKHAVLRLKKTQIDRSTGLTSDHVINARDDCQTHIALLFTAIAIHGTAPGSFLHSTIVPIPRTNTEMYLIVLISGKLFDNIALSPYADHLSSSELQCQFGFKAKSSTKLCSVVLKKSLAYYINNQSSESCTRLNTTQVFDRVRCCKMFKLLISRQLPATITRLLINFYPGN